MVIVLIIGFAIVVAVAILLKKRHDKRTNHSSTMPLPVGWAPNADPHYYSDGAEKGRPAGMATPHTAAETVGQPPDLAAAVRRSASQRRSGSNKLKKFVGR